VNAFKAEQEMAQTMLSELVQGLQNSMSTKSLNNMNTTAETQASTSGIFGGSSSANSNTNNIYNLQQINKTNTAIQNVIANSIQSNLNIESIQTCISNAAINQKVDFSGCQAGGNLNISELKQQASMATVTNCVNNSGSVNKVLSDVGNKLNVTVENHTTAETENTMINNILTSAITSGLGSCPCPGCTSLTGLCGWCCLICCIICILCICSCFCLPALTKR
jgi:hypothetical protein